MPGPAHMRVVLALCVCVGASSFPPTPFANGVLVNLTSGPRGSPFCSWSLSASGAFANAGSGLCLAVFNAAVDGAPVYLSPCNASSGAQLWTWVGAEMDGGLMFVGSGARGQVCATGVDPLRSPPSQLTLAPCTFAPWQQLTSDSDGNGTLSLEDLPAARPPLFVCSPAAPCGGARRALGRCGGGGAAQRAGGGAVGARGGERRAAA